LPPLGDDSGPALRVDDDEPLPPKTKRNDDEDTVDEKKSSDEERTSAAKPQAREADVDTAPRGVPTFDPAMPRPPLHYLLAALIVIATATLVYFLLRR
jgi:hypothetical protein